jgi:hypothetical protein
MDCPIVTPRWSVASDDLNKNHVSVVFDALIMADSVGAAEVQCSASAKTRAVYELPMLAHAIPESQNCTAVPDDASIDLQVRAGRARTT